ncbi:hypothetical protein [Rhizobium sp. RHZ01]|uniref:hypothetical protein n=1 Tax=Rhizobium sp. RHZ01 TaxID=2769304 RepID=UPI00177F34B9|nr:hypothetical protein [Rhizobium sp. RHZ01]MBD9447253.1 hypothetical protein [Rhizobium sp. RHZ01]
MRSLYRHVGKIDLEYAAGAKGMVERDVNDGLRPSPRTASNMSDAEIVCRKIYEETRSCYDKLKPALGSAALGFRILYGPPMVRAPYMFLGFQPGGRQDESDEGQHDGWPDQSWHANASSPLANHLRAVFGIETVKHTGLNMVFFRAPNMKAWDSIPSTLRRELEQFSLERAQRIVEVLEPQHLVVIGLRTFKQLTNTNGETALLGQRCNRLVVKGEFGGIPTSGIVHLSGARVSRQDREKLKEHFNPTISS